MSHNVDRFVSTAGGCFLAISLNGWSILILAVVVRRRSCFFWGSANAAFLLVIIHASLLMLWVKRH